MIDIIVVGGGHAGVEAALICAKMEMNTMLVSLDKKNIAKMPCNPSIGGPAKGIVVREIDALGGQMGITADVTALQFKMLNTTKGPGVQSLRVQSDKVKYQEMMQDVLEKQANLQILEAKVKRIAVKDKKIIGIYVNEDQFIEAKAVILTTGTYMSSLVMVSSKVTESGPDDEPTVYELSQSLRDVGIETFRLKTGTPPRVLTSSIDFSKTEIQPGTPDFYSFSFQTEQIKPFINQALCYLTYTSPLTHEIIKDNLHLSSMYSGVVKGVGPRYCPSIEDKIVRFADKERHQIFLEPESDSLTTTYVQGFSTSLPHEVQEKMVRSLPGLENCEIVKYAYAIEYDAVNPMQLKPTLESKKIQNLYTAGQINGTSGYEEAAGQGLMAGINASLKLQNKEPFILKRDEAYIGVMIDDLVTKGTLEPYRLLTSRAEFRLLLRHDNADTRLMPYAHDLKTISQKQYDKYLNKMQDIQQLKETLRLIRFTMKDDVNEYLHQNNYETLSDGISVYELLKRPHILMEGLRPYLDIDFDKRIARQVEIEIKYEGYIDKAKKDAAKLNQMEKLVLPENLDYDAVEHLSLEGRQKLKIHQPHTVGQASRISGVNPADIAVLAVHLEQRHRDNNKGNK